MMQNTLVVVLGLLVASSATRADDAKKPWMKPPGPIAGKWSATCDGKKGMVVEVSLQGDKAASGHIANVGEAKKYGYTQGEEILKLEVVDSGAWVGTLRWRNVKGDERWDPIHFVASADLLNADMTTDPCYRNMPHAK
jgi:hypothetical protein